MIVVFQSESENKSIKRVNRVLDAYANRIGRRSWMTAITQEGLDAVHHELRKIATKDTAVSCLLVKGRTHIELMWIVGCRDKFNSEGNVPVNETSKSKYLITDENEWENLPIIVALTGFAALWHDIGKASLWFQNKLKNNEKKGDPLRHEWISCMLFFAYIKSIKAKNDNDWLESIINEKIDGKEIIKSVTAFIGNENSFFNQTKDFPIFQLISWLILSHHRFPGSVIEKKNIEKFKGIYIDSFTLLLRILSPTLGYKTADDDSKMVLTFPNGIDIFDNLKWKQKIKKHAQRIQRFQEKVLNSYNSNDFFEILMLSRSCLVLGDHIQSSFQTENAKNCSDLIANLTKGSNPNQTLYEHLLGVEAYSLKVAYALPYIQKELPRAYDIKILKKKAPFKYRWQDKAIEKIKQIKTSIDLSSVGHFVLNMASTGSGKTIANAKILYSLSNDDSLRCSVLLGLRTLTMQTGREYRERFGLDEEDVCIVIGSKAFLELTQNTTDISEVGDEDSYLSRDLQIEGVEYSSSQKDDRLNEIIRDESAEKMLYPPVLVCTIDQLIKASERTRGAHNIVPIFRVLSSDIIIDEVDDFSGDDLYAIGRFVYLCGVMGRSLVLSSATIPPELAEGMASAYQRGWAEYARKHGKKSQVLCCFVDEFNTSTKLIQSYIEHSNENKFRLDFIQHHFEFIKTRINKLTNEDCPRKGEIVYINERTESCFFDSINKEILSLHNRHSEKDPKTQKNISFGLVRFSNIKQCIMFGRCIFNKEIDKNTEVKCIIYHAREVMLIRHEKEKYLDRILCRKNPKEIFSDSIIRKHIDNSNKDNLIFIVISSPIEELGRDHDFDWAIIEPASYRSIIQTAGRVLRHRDKSINNANIGILQFNYNAIKDDSRVCYCNPGFESEKYKLNSHDISQLINEEDLLKGINSVSRINIVDNSNQPNDFISLEHRHLFDIMEEKQKCVADDLSSYYSTPVFLTAFNQKYHPFRKESKPSIELILIQKDDKFDFYEDSGVELIKKTLTYGIEFEKNEENSSDWLNIKYSSIVNKESELLELSKDQIQKKFGVVCIPYENKLWIYSDRYGLEER